MKSKSRRPDRAPKGRKSLVFFQEAPQADVMAVRPLLPKSSGSDLADEVISAAQARLARFRSVRFVTYRSGGMLISGNVSDVKPRDHLGGGL